MNILSQMDAFRIAVLNFYKSDDVIKGLGGTSAHHRDVVINAIKDPLPLNTEYSSHKVPATQFWPQLVQGADSRFKDIVNAADPVFDLLHWKINENYSIKYDQM